MIDEQIKKENQSQFKTKIDRVVAKLRSKRGANIGSMWDVIKKVRRKKQEPPTAIKSKEENIYKLPQVVCKSYVTIYEF